MHKTPTFVLIGLAIAGVATAATLEEVDGNADGMVTLDELQDAMPEISEDVFRLVDVNEDGMIDADEFSSAQETGLLPAG